MRNLTIGEMGAARCMGLAAVILTLAATAPGHAGFYDPRQPTSPLMSGKGVEPLPFELLKDALDDLVRVGDPLLPSKLRDAAIARRDALLQRGPRSLTGDELAELGLLQHRLREPDKALETLKSAARRDVRNFWVYSNLASLQQAMGQYLEAFSDSQSAAGFVPNPWPQTPAAGAWFARCEKMQQQLLRSRLREGFGRVGVRPNPPTTVDDLFGVRFDGEFTAGDLPASEKAKVPADAIAVVQQLLLWFPEDTRLYWQLGELYNATDNIDAADKIFGECLWGRRFDAPLLREHRRIVKEAIAARIPPLVVQPFLPEGLRLWGVIAGAGTIFALIAYWQVRELVRRIRGVV